MKCDPYSDRNSEMTVDCSGLKRFGLTDEQVREVESKVDFFTDMKVYVEIVANMIADKHQRNAFFDYIRDITYETPEQQFWRQKTAESIVDTIDYLTQKHGGNNTDDK